MRYTTTIILAVIVIIGGVYIFFFETKQKSVEELEKASKKVIGIKGLSDKATKVRLQAEKNDPIVVKRKGEGSKAKWAMTKPRALRADKSEIKSVLSGLEFLDKKDQAKASESDLAKWGLVKPRGSISFWVDDKKTTLLIGSKCPDGSNVWARLADGDEVYKVAKSIFDKAKKSVNDIREKNILDITKDDVSRMELKFEDGAEIACSKEKEEWVLKRPVEDQGDKAEIDKLVGKLKDLKVDKDDFIAEEDTDLAKYGLDKPQLVAAVYQKDASQTVLVGKKVEGKDDKLYAKRKDEPAIVAIKKSFLKDMKKKPNDLRDKKVARFEKADVEKAEIKSGDKTVQLAKKDGDWSMSKPKKVKANKTEVENFFSDVTKLEVADFADDKPTDLANYGLDKPATEITLTLKGDKGERKLLIGSKKDKNDEKYYMKRAGQDPVFLVKAKELFSKVDRGYLAFLEKKVLKFDKDDVKKLTVKREDKTFACLKTDEGKWEATQPIKFAADKSRIENILGDMDDLEAKELVAEAPVDLKEYGLDKPSITATVEYEAEEEKAAEDKNDEKEAKAKDNEVKEKAEKGKEKSEEKEEKKKDEKNAPEKELATKSLLIGKKTESGDSYAKVADGKLIFTLQSWRVNDFKKELIDRQITKFDKDDVKTVTLTYPTKEVAYEKKDDKWRMTKPEDKEAKKSDVDDILNALDDFKGDDIAEYSTTKDGLKKYGFDKPQLKVTIALDEGEKTVLVGSKTSDNKFHIRTPASDFIFLAQQWDVNKLMKEKPAPPKKEEKKAEEKAPKPAAEKKKSGTTDKAAKVKAATQKKQEQKAAPAKEAKVKKGKPAAKDEGATSSKSKPEAKKSTASQENEKEAPKPQSGKKEGAPKMP